MNFVFYQSNEILSFSFFTFTNKKITEYIFHSNLTYIFFSLYHLLIVWKFVKFGAFILIYWMKFYILQNFNRRMIFFSSVLFHPARGILIYLDEILHFAKFQPADEFFSSSDSVLCTEEIYIWAKATTIMNINYY